MTLPVLLAHVAARWAATRTPTCGWVPDESEIEMTETKEWLTPPEFAEATGGKAASGTRMLVDGRPAVYCMHPTIGLLAARWTDEEGGYAVNLGLYEMLFHRSGIDAIRKLQHEQEEA